MDRHWWLRVQDETFGPVTREGLLEWARMGRIQPGQDVSEDGERWIPATDVAFLDMRWSIDIGDGTPRGPFNKQAAQALLASGRLPPGSRLVEAAPAPAAADAPPPAEPSPAPGEAPAAPEAEAAPEPAAPEKTSSDAPSCPVPPAQAGEVAELKLQVETLADELKRLPPTARLAADAQTAVYALMKDEADELAAALEAENREAEALREYRRRRIDRLLARRQEILKRIGTDAEDMTRRALRQYPEDPRTVHMRQELDALRVLQERSAQEAERKVRDLAAKLRERDAEVKRLREQAADATVIYRQLLDVREKLMTREKELMEERQKSEAERQQHAAAQQTLLARLSSLEMGMPGTTNQSREARNVRLAPWMGLKK